eukprot:1143957-Pelagomonas_calceolata.AAC.2
MKGRYDRHQREYLGGQRSSSAGIVGCGPAGGQFLFSSQDPSLEGSVDAMRDLKMFGRIRGGQRHGAEFTTASGFYICLWVSGVDISKVSSKPFCPRIERARSAVGWERPGSL